MHNYQSPIPFADDNINNLVRNFGVRQCLLGANERLVPPSAVTAFRRWQNQVEQRVAVAAALQFDNFAHVAALGARGIKKERQLLYTFDGFDLDLEIGTTDAQKTITLRGQLLAHTPPTAGLAGITVELNRDRYAPWRRLTDESGLFHFSRLQAGDYSLQVVLDTHDVRIEPLVLLG